MNPVHFSSATCEWPTPQRFFDRLDTEFGFTLDPCATPENAKCATFYTREDDGLSRPWPGVVFCNPPYGRELKRWVEKAYQESQGGSTVVVLMPSRTDAAYWHDYVMRADEVRLIRGRMRFVGTPSKGHNAPFPSCVVVFRPGSEGPPKIRSWDR